MAIKPTPKIYQCRECGWKTRYAPLSDALVEAPPEQCEQCGGISLDFKTASVVDNLSAAFSIFFGKNSS